MFESLKQFANTYAEKHSVWFGWLDLVFNPYPTPPCVLSESKGEEHYYAIGSTIGRITLIVGGIALGYLIFA
jgi:hypothetical protein